MEMSFATSGKLNDGANAREMLAMIKVDNIKFSHGFSVIKWAKAESWQLVFKLMEVLGKGKSRRVARCGRRHMGKLEFSLDMANLYFVLHNVLIFLSSTLLLWAPNHIPRKIRSKLQNVIK